MCVLNQRKKLTVLPKPPTSRAESRPPMSKKRPTEAGATRGGPHHAPRLRPDQCMLCRQVGHRASACPNNGKATAFSPGKRAFGTHAPGCAVFDAPCYGATVEQTEQDQDENDIQDFVAFSIKSVEGFARHEVQSEKLQVLRNCGYCVTRRRRSAYD